jgi:hypothetical protein
MSQNPHALLEEAPGPAGVPSAGRISLRLKPQSRRSWRAGAIRGVLSAAVSLLLLPVLGRAQTNACDLNQDGSVNIVDVNLITGMVLGTQACTVNITGAGVCNVVTVQRVVNAALGQPCVADSTSAAGLMAAYSFDEGTGTTVADASGNSNSGTLSGAAWTTQGRFGNALSFNGSNSSVVVANSASLGLTTGMTLEAWVFPTTNSGWRTVLMKQESGGYVYAMFSSENGEYSSQGPRPAAWIPDAARTYNDYVLGSPIPTNQWAHLAATFDGQNMRFYVNGALSATRPASTVIRTSTGALRIGGNTLWGEWFQGRIDDVRIYNRALSQAEIQSDMNTPVGSTVPPDPADTTPPTISITSPGAGATVNGNVTVSVTASDNVAMAGVQFMLDGANLGSEVTGAGPTYTFNWNTTTASNGSHTLSARARDAAGNTTTSAGRTVTVSNSDTTAPTVSMTAPAAGATVSGNVTVSASASDNVGVVGVQFLLDGANLGSEVTGSGPYSRSWNTTTASNGSHTLSARARDAAGNTTTSAGRSVTVSNGTVTPRTVTLNWVASTTPSVLTNVYRATTSGGPYTKLNATPFIGVTYVDSTVQSGQTYYYVVRAVDSSGNESVNSNQATAVVP